MGLGGYVMRAGRRRVAAISVVVAVCGAVLGGCGPTTAGSGQSASGAPSAAVPGPEVLSFTYHATSPQAETIDQTLQINNSFPASLVPTLSFTALDKHHHALPRVRVGTVFGSDHGKLVVHYGAGMDILRFSGPGEHEVADVRVAVQGLAFARIPSGVNYVQVQALDSGGRPVDKFSRFTAVRLTNQDTLPVSVRVAYLVYDQPPAGETQQAVSVTEIGGLTRVPAHGTAVVKVDGDAASAVARYSGGPAVSIKSYFSQ